MSVLRCLFALVLALPLAAEILCLVSGGGMAERLHSHHNTYSISLVVSRALTLVMVFMGVLGALTAWLCRLGVFHQNPLLPLSFCIAFEFTILLMVKAVLRYQVMSCKDHITVRGPFVSTRTIRYADIDRMEWRWSYLGPHLRDLWIHASDGTKTRIWCLVDVERLLLQIDRFDVLHG